MIVNLKVFGQQIILRMAVKTLAGNLERSIPLRTSLFLEMRNSEASFSWVAW